MLIGKLGKVGRILIPALLVAFIFFMGYYVWRDLNLPLSVDLSNIPDVQVEDLDFRREIGAQEWIIKTKKISRTDGVSTGYSMDVTIKGINDRINRFVAEEGRYFEASADISLSSVRGIMEENNTKLLWSADKARYDGDTKKWIFTDGVTMQRNNLKVDAAKCSVTPDGVVQASGGVIAKWDEK